MVLQFYIIANIIIKINDSYYYGLNSIASNLCSMYGNYSYNYYYHRIVILCPQNCTPLPFRICTRNLIITHVLFFRCFTVMTKTEQILII